MTANMEAAKSPLDREELRDVIDLALWAGQMLLQNGADAERVEETVQSIGTELGAEGVDALVSPNALIVTTSSGAEFRTKVRRIISMGVNMTVVEQISHLNHRVAEGKMDRFVVRSELTRISDMPHEFNRWQIVITVGLACAAFSRLFGGDLPVIVITFLAAAIAMYVRQLLTRHNFNALLIVIATAFVSGLIASSASILHLSDHAQTALVASVLLLVPGVHLINSIQDIIKGHIVIGLVRGFTGLVISLCIALGLLLAMQLAGVSGI
ncbi:MAG: threonine/serine exporter family protein [Anaerolineae bacterium]